MSNNPPDSAKLLRQVLPLGLFVVAWQILAVVLESNVFPTPSAIVVKLVDLSLNENLPQQVAITLYRVACAFVISMLFGIVIGVLIGLYPRVDQIFEPALIMSLNIPALVVIFMCFIAFGLNDFAAILAVVINKTPNVAVTIREGTRSIDRQLSEMAESFQLSNSIKLRRVYLPQLYPYILAAMRNGLPLVWKVILVVELIGCSSGVGFELGVYFQYFDITAIFAYTLAFVGIVASFEYGLIKPFERYIARWRG